MFQSRKGNSREGEEEYCTDTVSELHVSLIWAGVYRGWLFHATD